MYSPFPPTLVIDEFTSDIQPYFDLEGISFGELTQDFVSSPLRESDLPANYFDIFLTNVNIDIVPIINESDIYTKPN